MTSHMNKIGNKLSKVVGVFKRIKNYIPLDTMLLMYNSLFLPHLNYSLLAWGYSCTRIFSLQKRVIRLICQARYIAHTDPLFKKLNILKVDDLLHLKALKFYFRYTKNDLPDYFQNMFSVSPPSHTHFTRRNKTPLPIPARARSKNYIRFYLPVLLQNLPPCIIDKLYTHSFSGFSSYVKIFYVNSYSDVCNIPNCYVCNL